MDFWPIDNLSIALPLIHPHFAYIDEKAKIHWAKLKILEVDLLKWYYDQKITFIISSDFETVFTKHYPIEIWSLNFEKKSVYLNCNFPF